LESKLLERSTQRSIKYATKLIDWCWLFGLLIREGGGGGGEIEASWESVRDNPKAMKKFCGGR